MSLKVPKNSENRARKAFVDNDSSVAAKIRFAFVVVGAIAGAVFFGQYGQEYLKTAYSYIAGLLKMTVTDKDNPYSNHLHIPVAVSMAVFGGIIGGFLARTIVLTIERSIQSWDRMDKGDKITLFLGFFLGLVVSIGPLMLFKALDLPGTYQVVFIVATMVGACALSVYGLQTMSDFLPWNRTRSKTRRSGIKVLDTNVIIDGRIHDVVKSGFLEGQLYVPQFVLEELQYIADSHDSLKRQRGRRGLEVLKHMQADYQLQVGIYDKYAPDAAEEVDARLVRLCKAIGADIVTNDFNLNRVAVLQEVKVLSLNDLALSLRTNVLPEETISLKIIREGNQFGQGVGYLEDGTMVVVENGQPHVGEMAEVTVTQVIQTERGKMIFAEYEGDESEIKYEQRKRNHGNRRH